MVGWGLGPIFQFSMLSPYLLKSQIPYTVGGGGLVQSARIPISLYGGGGGGGAQGLGPTSNFWCWVQIC